MGTTKGIAQEQAEDIFFGQVVIIWARWVFITSVIILSLWASDTTSEIFIAVIPVALLMAMNFYLHARYIIEKPANELLTQIFAYFDLLVVTLLIVLWPDASGAESGFFILYYPLVLAVAFVLPPRVSLIYIVSASLAYVVGCIAVDASFLANSLLLEAVSLRTITLAATGVLGAFYWRVQRDRLRSIQDIPA